MRELVCNQFPMFLKQARQNDISKQKKRITNPFPQKIPYTGNDSWVEKTIIEAHKCLNSSKIPKAKLDCDYCDYVKAIRETV